MTCIYQLLEMVDNSNNICLMIHGNKAAIQKVLSFWFQTLGYLENKQKTKFSEENKKQDQCHAAEI